MKDLKQTTVIGLGLLGASISSAVMRSFPQMKVVGYSHRASTRDKARQLAVATQVVDDMSQSVAEANLVILATPICTFEQIFSEIGGALASGCIVTDVGSTKVLPHRWAAAALPRSVHYVGSHPIAGSEQRGVEFARDDLFDQAMCILTTVRSTNRQAVRTLDDFWSGLGCFVRSMSPAQHDRVFANVSHLPHITAAALVNATAQADLKFAGKGFIDTSRIASGPPNIWADVLMTNAGNAICGIDRLIAQLTELKNAIKSRDESRIEKLLEKARTRRAALIDYKIKSKEIIS